MDKERRSRLKRVVTEARKVVEKDVRVQLRRLGFDESGKVKPVEELPHISGEDRELRDNIVEAVEKEKTGGISDREAFDRYVRHVGFTSLNRIAALRAMEVRKLIKKETVLRRDVYGGKSCREYEIADREGIVDPYRLLKASLVEAFREVSAEIKVLFDVNSEYSLVFLGHKALLELIRLLSEEVSEEDWKEDDIIGWIYQYYNEEARAEFKRAKRKLKADDIPVVNQFYTPRWVVRVLVDNTLGRLWLEMNGRCPKLGDPIERTKEQLANPSGDTVVEFSSYLVPLSQEYPRRERKRVREIKVLDPACGSGHFLVYAFDVLYRMYREEEQDTPTEEIPRLILENNLYGIDIDLRAVQLAALSLYLKAKLYNPKLKITKINLVCADARITDGKVRKAFLKRFSDDPELQKIFARIFEDLEYTFDVGSLLKVREPFERLLERRREEGMQAILFPRIAGQTVISKGGKIEGQTELAMSVLDEEEQQETIVISKATTLDQMIGALKEFEKEAMEKRDMGTLLFATEAEKSVGLLALLTEKYDVVLMNPAYGDMPRKTKEYFRKHYPRTHHDYYTAFIEQSINLCELGGFIGMLTSRTFMYLKWYEKIREEILWNEAIPELILDLGFGVLDGAIVETVATVCRVGPADGRHESPQCFIKITHYGTDDKEDGFKKALDSIQKNVVLDNVYFVSLKELAQIPGRTYAYWAPSSLRSIFTRYKHIEPEVCIIRAGLSTGDDQRFVRHFVEIDPSKSEIGSRWVPFAKGGKYSKFYSDIDLVLDWAPDAIEVMSNQGNALASRRYYFRVGLTYSRVTVKGISVRLLPKGCAFSDKGPSVFPQKTEEYLWAILSLLNSKLAWYCLLMQTPSRSWEVRHVGALPWPGDSALSQLPKYAIEAYNLLSEWDTGNESSTIFIKPWVLQVLHGFNNQERSTTGHPSGRGFRWSDWSSLKEIRSIVGNKQMNLQQLSKLAIRREETMRRRLDELQTSINKEVYQLYKISEEDRKIIERELAMRRGETSFCAEEARKAREEEQIEVALYTEAKINDHVERLASFYLKKTLESDPDGILPLHELGFVIS